MNPQHAWPCAPTCQVPAPAGTQDAALHSLGQKPHKAAEEWGSRLTEETPSVPQKPRLLDWVFLEFHICLDASSSDITETPQSPTLGSPVLHLLCGLPDSQAPGPGPTAQKVPLGTPQSS